MTLGQRIAQRRKALALSQEALAETVGVSRQAVSKWELDEAQPDAAKVVLLAQALGVTTDELLLGKPEDAEPPGAPSPASDGVETAKFLGKTLRRFLKKHGYKAGYLLMVYGLVLLLFAGAGFLMFRGFFAAADETAQEFNSFSIGWGAPQSVVQFEPADGVSLTPEEIAVIERELAGQVGFTPSVQTETHGFPVALQRAVYIVLALPALLGAALIVAGIVVVVKYKGKYPVA